MLNKLNIFLENVKPSSMKQKIKGGKQKTTLQYLWPISNYTIYCKIIKVNSFIKFIFFNFNEHHTQIGDGNADEQIKEYKLYLANKNYVPAPSI